MRSTNIGAAAKVELEIVSKPHVHLTLGLSKDAMA